MASLKKIIGKFDIVQNSLRKYKYMTEFYFVNVLGCIWRNCENNCPFNIWYTNCGNYLDNFNRALRREKAPVITRKEMKLIYENIRGNLNR